MRRSRKVIFALCSAPERCIWRMPNGKTPQIKQTPSYNSNKKTLTSQRESRGGPQDAHGSAIKEILIKHRAKVSRIVKQQHWRGCAKISLALGRGLE